MDSPHEGDIYSKQARTSSLENSRDTSLRQTRWLNEKTMHFNPEVLSSNPVVAYDKLTFFKIILKIKWKSISLDQLKHPIIKCWVKSFQKVFHHIIQSSQEKPIQNLHDPVRYSGCFSISLLVSSLLYPPSYDPETDRAQPYWRTSQFSNCTGRSRGSRREEASWGVMSEDTQVYPMRKLFIA